MSELFYKFNEEVLRLEREGRSIIKLNVGHTALPTPPCAIQALTDAINDKKSGYGSAQGDKALLKAISEREGVPEDCICVGPGSKQLIFALLSIFKKNSGTLVTTAPYWPAYPLICKQIGLNFNAVESSFNDNWALPDIPLTKDTSAVLICNPQNPTSILFQEEALQRLAKKTAANHIPLIIDEAYRDIAFSTIQDIPGAIRVRTFSKEFNMEGFRLGYVVAAPSLIKELIYFNQLTITCLPHFIQEAGREALTQRDHILKKHKALWHERLNTLSKALRETGFSFINPEAAMYVFATHAKIDDSMTFIHACLKKGVALAPGIGFGSYKNFFRISASEEIPVLMEAVNTISEAL